jgi:hypothetical protein
MLHTYAYVPGVSNVRENVAPEARFPLPVPSANVTVWAAPSSFVHVTVLPGATVAVPGANAKSLIATADGPAAAGLAGAAALAGAATLAAAARMSGSVSRRCPSRRQGRARRRGGR